MDRNQDLVHFQDQEILEEILEEIQDFILEDRLIVEEKEVPNLSGGLQIRIINLIITTEEVSANKCLAKSVGLFFQYHSVLTKRYIKLRFFFDSKSKSKSKQETTKILKFECKRKSKYLVALTKCDYLYRKKFLNLFQNIFCVFTF